MQNDEEEEDCSCNSAAIRIVVELKLCVKSGLPKCLKRQFLKMVVDQLSEREGLLSGTNDN